MQPLRVEFTLRTPVRIPDYPIHFDGVLAYAAVQEGFLNGVPIEDAQQSLPLDHEGEDDLHVWKASWIDFSPGGRDMIRMSRPFRLDEIVGDMGTGYAPIRRETWKQEMTGSVNKAYLLDVPVRHSRSAVAWCVGDAERVLGLLTAHVTHLGKLARIDLGRIGSIAVAEDERALTLWKRRSLPLPLDGYARAFETVRPPYWRRDLRQEAWVPV